MASEVRSVIVAVCGGREYADWFSVFMALDEVRRAHGDFTVVHGGAGKEINRRKGAPITLGADRLAGEWAGTRNLPCEVVRADWSLGRRAGPLRNQQILEEYDVGLVVAFPGGAGTADMVMRALAHNVEVLQIEEGRYRP